MAALGTIFGIIIAIALCVLAVIGTWKFFEKNKKPGWAALIPIYREVVMWQISELPLYYILVGLIVPILGTFYIIAMYMHIAEKFNKPRSRAFGIGMLFLPYIFMPILAFGKDKKDKVKNNGAVLFGLLLYALTILIVAVSPLVVRILIAIALIVITIVATWKAFKLQGKPGWAALIPIYREIVIWQISGLSLAYLLLALLVPGLNVIFMIIIYINFAKKYNRSGLFGVGLCCIPYCFMPILAFSKEKKEAYEKPSAFACGLLLLVFTLFVIVATVPWSSYFTKFTAFNDFNAWLAKAEILKYVLAAPTVTDSAASTTGIIPVLGTWQISDLSIFLIVISLLIVAFSDVKLGDFIPEVGDKIKKALPIGFITIVISLVLIILITSGVNVTLVNLFAKASDKLNIVGVVLGGIVGSVTTADFYYYLSTLYTSFRAAAGETYYPVVAFAVQAIYYLTMIIAPTSVGLLVGLSALDISYGSWFKYIWKVLLTVLFLLVMTIIVFYLFVAKHVALAIALGIFGFAVLVGILVLAISYNNKK